MRARAETFAWRGRYRSTKGYSSKAHVIPRGEARTIHVSCVIAQHLRRIADHHGVPLHAAVDIACLPLPRGDR